MSTPRVAIFVAFSGQGGVERMIAHLARGLLEAGIQVDLLLARAQGDHLQSLPEGARVFDFNGRHTWSALPALVRYLRRERPDALLAAKHRAIQVSLLARRLSGAKVRLVGRIGTTVSAALEGRSALRRALWYRSMRRSYRRLDALVAVSHGVARDLFSIVGLTDKQVHVIANPVVLPEMFTQAQQAPAHPWYGQPEVAVLVSAGRLTRQKDFPTLLRAFALLRQQRPARLVILGDGRQRAELETLARELGIESDVALPGFVHNAYAWLAHAALFVLSSRWEGSPNVLTEALALGVPVVATDCPSGPREILDGGRVGRLVPVGDAQALATAMLHTLQQPPASDQLRQAAAEYTLAHSAAAYGRVLGVLSKPEPVIPSQPC